MVIKTSACTRINSKFQGDVVMGIVAKDRERYRKIFGERDKQKEYWVHSVCSLCYNECANRVRVLDGKPVAAEGVPESDKGAQGGLCAKGVTSVMDWYNPNRILYPVKRTNPKKGCTKIRSGNALPGRKLSIQSPRSS